MLEISVPVNILQLLFCLAALFFALNRRSRFFFSVCPHNNNIQHSSILVLCVARFEFGVWHRVSDIPHSTQLRAVHRTSSQSNASFSCSQRPCILSGVGAFVGLSVGRAKQYGLDWRRLPTTTQTCESCNITTINYDCRCTLRMTVSSI